MLWLSDWGRLISCKLNQKISKLKPSGWSVLGLRPSQNSTCLWHPLQWALDTTLPVWRRADPVAADVEPKPSGQTARPHTSAWNIQRRLWKWTKIRDRNRKSDSSCPNSADHLKNLTLLQSLGILGLAFFPKTLGILPPRSCLVSWKGRFSVSKCRRLESMRWMASFLGNFFKRTKAKRTKDAKESLGDSGEETEAKSTAGGFMSDCSKLHNHHELV